MALAESGAKARLCRLDPVDVQQLARYRAACDDTEHGNRTFASVVARQRFEPRDGRPKSWLGARQVVPFLVHLIGQVLR